MSLYKDMRESTKEEEGEFRVLVGVLVFLVAVVAACGLYILT